MDQRALSFSPFANTYIYDVFLSFRGEDTRTGFAGNLYSALSQRGMLAFMDDVGLRKGGEITPSLLNAIQKSRMAIIIFSQNYASSTFCLNELVQVLECYTKEKGQWILPIFYDVDPSEVRRQTGSYREALAEHEGGRFKDDIDKVQKWRFALSKAADLSGWHFKHGVEYEHEFIRKILEEVSHKLNRPLLHIADYPVGLEARMQNVLSLMGPEFDNKVNMLGIHGIGGIGKSTLARAIYNLIADQFEGSCFLANVREKSTGNGLVRIQETVLSELVGERNIKLADVNQGIPILKERLHRKRVLLILDDVDKKEQLKAIAGGFDWFGFGSIIIVTTRDKHLLDIHGVEKVYDVKEFNDTESIELFRWNALKNKVDPSYMEMIKRAIYYAGGLPLALETIGSNLFGKTLDEWESALEAYERIPNRDVLEILRVSYDGLEETQKEIFLDIACFFKGSTLKYVTNMLHARRGFRPEYGIRVLEKKSLINIWRYNGEIIVTMHGLIQYMGKEIVIQQSTWPEKSNRLWFYEDIICVMEKNKENDKIEAMMLDFPEDEEVQWNEEVFGKMENLMMLMKKKGCLLGSPKHLPKSLRVLEWRGYPTASLPSNFHSKNLVILNLSYSYFRWDKQLQESKVLSQLIFTGCEYIRQIPDMSGFPNLTELCVDDCTNLIKIHNSVGFLDKLLRFSAKGCTKLRIVPRGIKSTSLEYLCLRDCRNLVKFPEILGPMEKLKFVDLEGTAIENLPLSMQNLQGLQRLHLNRCKRLENKALSNILQMLPNFFPFLKTLRLRDSNLTILPACIEQCHFLELLDLCNCQQLQEIRGLPPSTNFLAYNCPSLKVRCSTLNTLQSRAIGSAARKFYVLPGQRIPEWFDHTSKGNSLCFWFQKEFPSIVVCAVLGVWDDTERPFHVNFNFYVKINDIEIPFLFYFNYILETDHIFMLNYFYLMNVDIGSLISENRWSYGEVLFVIPPDSGCSGTIKWTGVYVNRTFTRMEDVRFTNPYENYPMLLGENMLQVQPLTEQFAFQPVMHPFWEQPLDNVYSNLVPGESSQVQRATQMGDVQFTNPYENPPMLLGENTLRVQPLHEEFAFQHAMNPYWEQPWNNVYSNLVPGKSSQVQRPIVTTGEILQQPLLDTGMIPWISDISNNRGGAFVDHQENFPGQSSQARSFVETLNIQLQNLTSSSGPVRRELNLGTSSPMLLSTVGASLRNQTELTRADDVEMEVFYASLDAETHVPCSHDKSATTAPSEEAKEALKILQDFIFNDASVLLHLERCSVMKTILENLSNLSADDGISTEMRTLISEASREFTHWSRDYNEASMKIQSTASELQRADELEASLETNKNQFREVGVLENQLLQKLARMEKIKKDLQEQINVIESNISASQSEKKTILKRKRDVFEEGKTLKTQRDEMREKAPNLQDEHGLAKETQTRIQAEWSKLREKLKKIVVE